MKKHMLLVLTIIMALSLLLACTQPSLPEPPPPPSSPGITPAPTPQPTTPGITPAPSRQSQKVGLLANRPPTGMYTYSFALATLINRYSPWLQVDLKTTTGAAEHLRTMAEKPEERSRVFYTSTGFSADQAMLGVGPFEKAYTGARIIAAFDSSMQFLVTYDSNITAKEDLIGKSIMLFPKAFAGSIYMTALIEDVWGLRDKVKLSYGPTDAIARGLRDGTIQVGQFDGSGMPGGSEWAPAEELNQLALEKPGFHLFGSSIDDIRALPDVLGLPITGSTAAPMSLDPNQTNPITGPTNILAWYADIELDPDIVYEITRVLYEHTEGFKELHPGSRITPETMADIPGMTEDSFHPGAVRLYKEKGINISSQ